MIFCAACLMQFCSFGIAAQEKNKVVYEVYQDYPANILRLLKKEGGITTFTGMSALKREAEKVKENTLITVNLRKANRKTITAAEIVKERKESVLMVCRYVPATTQPEKVVHWASAVVISEDGVCITNYHVLRSLIDQQMKINPTDSILFVATGAGKLYPIKSVLSFNKAADLAIFKIDPGNDQLTVFPAGEDLPAGTAVNTLTHPDGYLFYYSRGVVARNMATDARNPFTNRTEITADYGKGSSGGAIFDDYGNLVAMVSTTYSMYYMERPQTNLQMVIKSTIPISSILRLIQKK